MTRGIDAKILASMRAAAVLYLPDTCTIFRKTGETNSNGIAKPTFDAGTTSNCRWRADTGTKVTEQGKVFATGTCTVELPALTNITVNDYLVFDSRKWGILSDPPVDALTANLVVKVKELR